MKMTWPMVAVIGLVLGFLTAIFRFIPSSDATSRSALLGVIIAAANVLVLYAVGKVQHQAERTEVKLDQIQAQTNGHMTQLIDAKTQPDVSRETGAPDADHQP